MEVGKMLFYIFVYFCCMNKMDFFRNYFFFFEKVILNIFKLFDEGVIIFFILCYWKEMIGGLDEVEIVVICDLVKKYEELIVC